jgi:hypothetical protein
MYAIKNKLDYHIYKKFSKYMSIDKNIHIC